MKSKEKIKQWLPKNATKKQMKHIDEDFWKEFEDTGTIIEIDTETRKSKIIRPHEPSKYEEALNYLHACAREQDEKVADRAAETLRELTDTFKTTLKRRKKNERD